MSGDTPTHIEGDVRAGHHTQQKKEDKSPTATNKMMMMMRITQYTLAELRTTSERRRLGGVVVLVVVVVGRGRRPAEGAALGAREDVLEELRVARLVGGLAQDVGEELERLGALLADVLGDALVAEELGGRVAERVLDVDDRDAPRGLEDRVHGVGLLGARDGRRDGRRRDLGARLVARERLDLLLDRVRRRGRPVRLDRLPRR
mmetsp:Transcript_24369/g.96651  ORF Transcript_24369/g.96651 Transcript_24369/m.96651 type:complete len:204 (-) Transcript_24369:1664-2275(-)